MLSPHMLKEAARLAKEFGRGLCDMEIREVSGD
jgi:hypothetical protein